VADLVRKLHTKFYQNRLTFIGVIMKKHFRLLIDLIITYLELM